MNFPDDADGDVLRLLLESKFDFNKPTEIDFQIDFNSWPPEKNSLDLLCREFSEVQIFEPEDDYAGYVQVTITEKLTYETVVSMQQRITKLVSIYGGYCESWGVLH